MTPYSSSNFKIDFITLKYNNGQSINIDKGAVLQLEYREGLFAKFISVTLKIADTTSKMGNALVGMEEFQLKFIDEINKVTYDFTSGSTNGPLYAYNIHSKSVIDTGKMFVVELCRKDAILSMQKRVCKKYTNVKADELVTDIIKEELESNKSINNQTSFNKLTFVPPSSRPLDVLVWARNKYIGDDQKPASAKGKYTSAGYLFYETYDAYNFVSIDRISGQKGYKAIYTTGTGTSSSDDVRRIESVEFVNSIDMVTNFDRGFYSGQIEFFDIVNCTMTTEKYTLKELFPTWNRIGNSEYYGSMDSEVMKDDMKPVAPNVQPHQKYATRNMMVSYNSDLFAGTGDSKDEDKGLYRETVVQSISRLGIFTSQVLTATCNIGNMSMCAGDPIFLEFFDSKGELDPLHSGRYVIADLTHLYTRSEDKLKTYLTLVRDSFGL